MFVTRRSCECRSLVLVLVGPPLFSAFSSPPGWHAATRVVMGPRPGAEDPVRPVQLDQAREEMEETQAPVDPRKVVRAVPPRAAADRRAAAADRRAAVAAQVPPVVRRAAAAPERAEARARRRELREQEESAVSAAPAEPLEGAGAAAPRVPERPARPEKVALTAAPAVLAAAARPTPAEKAEARPTGVDPEMAAHDSVSS
jgi:hypothetical protein